MTVGNADPIHIGQYKTNITQLVNNDSTRGKLGYVAGVNGARVHEIVASSNDTSSRVVNSFRAVPLTLQSAMGTGAFVDGGAGSDTITRSSGSFVTDGWRVGDVIFVSNPTTVGNEFIATLTAVAAGTLTFATATVATAENIPSGSIIYKLGLMNAASVTTLAGTDGSTANIDMLSTKNSGIDAAPYRAETLGDGEALIFQPQVAITAAKYINIITKVGEYLAHS